MNLFIFFFQKKVWKVPFFASHAVRSRSQVQQTVLPDKPALPHLIVPHFTLAAPPTQEGGGIEEQNAIDVQCKPLNVITDNVIIRLMWSNWPSFVKSQITLSKVFFRRRRFVYCYHSDNVITFCLSQNDHIKRLPLYLKTRKGKRRAAKHGNKFSKEITHFPVILTFFNHTTTISFHFKKSNKKNQQSSFRHLKKKKKTF